MTELKDIENLKFNVDDLYNMMEKLISEVCGLKKEIEKLKYVESVGITHCMDVDDCISCGS